MLNTGKSYKLYRKSIKQPSIQSGKSEVNDMQNMIKRIVEADNEAKALEEANRNAAEEEKKQIEMEAEAIYQKYMDEAREEIAKSDAYLEKRTDRKLKNVAAKQESALIKLKSDYEQNRDRWVDEIVSRVVS